ncbi:unnamed protein product [Darwinula stevensoni]|uniref:Uncharacterized protein n=1 Tax=Darwinula stevensoni TaxID=69355 RepID=A0A7R9FRK9_9CRUS|nr:unnamed protein product [Darwinula stevensoni]CAG0901587.1 unnamed protein product [Darwinula stevensoni]
MDRRSSVLKILLQMYYIFSLLVSLTFLSGQVEWKSGLAALTPRYISETAYTDLSIANVVLSILWIISDSLLILGILTRKRMLMIPCLALSFLWLTVGTIAAIAFFAIGLAPVADDVVFLTVLATVFVFVYCIGVYLFLVVYSCFKELESLVPPGETQAIQPISENVSLGYAQIPTTKDA